MDFFAVGWCQFINILLPSCVSNTLSIFPIYSCTKAWSFAWFLALLSDATSKFSIIPFTLPVDLPLMCAMTSSYLSFCSWRMGWLFPSAHVFRLRESPLHFHHLHIKPRNLSFAQWGKRKDMGQSGTKPWGSALYIIRSNFPRHLVAKPHGGQTQKEPDEHVESKCLEGLQWHWLCFPGDSWQSRFFSFPFWNPSQVRLALRVPGKPSQPTCASGGRDSTTRGLARQSSSFG